MGLFDKNKTAIQPTGETGQHSNASAAKKKPLKGRAKSVQDVLAFEGITNDGVIIANGYYSKLYKLIDSNFITEPEDKQYDVLLDYTKLANRFPDNVDISIVIVNKRNPMADLAKNFHLAETGDNNDKFRKDYNAIIDQKITEGRNDITKEKYIMLTAKERSLDDAETTFNSIDLALNDAVKAIRG